MEGKVKVWWDEKEGLIRGCLTGEFDENMAKVVAETAIKILEQHDEKTNMLFDLSKLRKILSPARKRLVELRKHPNINRAAIWGASTFIRVVANFIIAATGKYKMTKHFGTEKEALKWLKGA